MKLPAPRGLRALAALALSLAVLGATAGSAAATVLTTVRDAEVQESAPAKNFGTAAKLHVDAADASGKRVWSYVAFDLSAVSGTVMQAILRVEPTSANRTGTIDVYGTDNRSWVEAGSGAINWSNRPAVAAAKVGSTAAVTGANLYYPVDVTNVVAGTSGVVTFALQDSNSTAIAIASRESTAPAAPPVLEITTASATGPPSAVTGDAAGVTATAATLNGTVNPHGLETSYQFQWGAGPGYDNSTAVTSAGAGTSDVAAPAALSGLSAGTSYHYRLTATNGEGTAVGADRSFTTANASGGMVVVAQGDTACDPTSSSFKGGLGTTTACKQKATSDLALALSPAAVLSLGDNQYEDNTLAKYQQSWDLSWGRLKGITYPALGNHEYTDKTDPGAAGGYFAYFGAAAGPAGRGYYSFDLGSWHLISLNSECGQIGGCGAGSAEDTWLRADLAAHPAACTLAYWHRPRFTSGSAHPDATEVTQLWNDLRAAGAEIVLSGHNHNYERFDTLGATSATAIQPIADPNGIREFVVGTGGKSLVGFGTTAPLANELMRSAASYGVLELVLRDGGYDWQFVPATGSFTDSGSGACH